MYQNDRLADPHMDQTDLAAFELSDEQLAAVAGGDGYAPPNGNPNGPPYGDNNPGYPGNSSYPGNSGGPNGYGYPGYAGPFGYGGLGSLLPLLGL